MIEGAGPVGQRNRSILEKVGEEREALRPKPDGKGEDKVEAGGIAE